MERLPVSDPVGRPSDAAREVTVVVPTRNSARTLRACLSSVRAQTLPCTLVVVDNGSTDDTMSIAEELADLVIEAGPERSAQRNIGAAATSTSIVGFIDSDMVLSADVVREATHAIHAGATAVIVPERTVGEGFWADVRAYEKTFYDGSDSIEAPRFLTRVDFEALGGFDEAITGGEDWDLGVRIAAHGRLERIAPVILHSEGRVRYLEACRKKGYYAVGVARFLGKHGSRGVALFSQRPWLRRPWRLLNPLGLGLVALKAGEMSAVLAALAREQLRLLPPGAQPYAGDRGPQGAQG